MRERERDHAAFKPPRSLSKDHLVDLYLVTRMPRRTRGGVTRVVQNESTNTAFPCSFFMYLYIYIYMYFFLSFPFFSSPLVVCERAAYVYIITRIRVPLRDKFVQKVWAVARMDI